MSALRFFAHLSTLEREGARRIARALLRDGMSVEGVRHYMANRRGVDMGVPEIQALARKREEFGGKPVQPGAQGGKPDCPARGRKAGWWSDEENAALRRLHAQGADIAAMMAALNRSAGSIDNQRRRLGLKSHRKRKWSGEDEDRLRAMVAAGARRAEIAKALKRTPQAISHKLNLLQGEG